MLELRGVTHRYGSVTAVEGVSLDIGAGARHALIGPNGAGKSTLFAMIAGSVRVDSGSVLMDGRDVTRWPDHRRARAGLGRSYQNGSLFEEFTALDNVVLGVQRKLRSVRSRSGVRDRAMEYLEQAGLAARSELLAARLSHGERRQLEVAMALATGADYILLDEPSAGMSPAETERFVELIHSLPNTIAMLLIEHDLNIVFELATHVSVLDLGRLIYSGSPEGARRSPDVRRAYLGDPDKAEIL